MDKIALHKRLIRWIKCEWEIFCFVESVDTQVLSKYEIDAEVKRIRNRYKWMST